MANAYDLNIASLHQEPEQTITGDNIEELKNLLKHHPAKILIWEGKPLPETLTKLEKIGVKSITFSPLANPGSEIDFIESMQESISNLNEIIQ